MTTEGNITQPSDENRTLKFLPTNKYNKLIYKKSKNYRENCKLKWAFCRYIWEAHVDLPEIDIDELQDFILKIK